MKERHDWRSVCRRAGARTIISTFSLKGLRGEYRTLPRSVLLHAFGLLLSVRVCVAVRCAVVVFVDSFKVCIQHSVTLPPVQSCCFVLMFAMHAMQWPGSIPRVLFVGVPLWAAVTWINSARVCIRGPLELRSNC